MPASIEHERRTHRNAISQRQRDSLCLGAYPDVPRDRARLRALQEDVKLATLAGLSTNRFNYLCKNLASALPVARQSTLDTVKSKLIIDEDEIFSSAATGLPDTLTVPLQVIENLLASSPPTEPPSTPKAGTKTPDILGVVISPPSAVLRSPAATGLTKTYLNNDFRQLRQVPSTRMNTSRLPSTHGMLHVSLVASF